MSLGMLPRSISLGRAKRAYSFRPLFLVHFLVHWFFASPWFTLARSLSPCFGSLGFPEGAFRLAEYLKEFLAKATGEGISAFQSKDGRQLAPHQCMVRRDQWCRVRGRFLEAFRVQRSAYRRCHGGSNAPAIYENKKLELLDARLRPQGRVRAPQRSMLVIRKTFWDVEEPARSMKRRRTVSFPLSQLMGK